MDIIPNMFIQTVFLYIKTNGCLNKNAIGQLKKMYMYILHFIILDGARDENNIF